MKRWMLAVCAVLAGASLCYGGGLGVFISQFDPDDDNVDSTTGGGAKLQLGDTLGLELRGSYFDDDLVTIMPADVGAFLKFPLGDSPVSLYGQGGVTWYFLDSDDVEIDDEVGWYAGGGVEIGLGDGLALFAEAQYRQFEYTAEGDDPEELDENAVDVNALTYSAGLLLTF